MEKETNSSFHDVEPDKIQKKKRSEPIEISKCYWPEHDIKIFFIGLKAYGKDYQKIHSFILEQDPKFDKNVKSVCFFFHRIFMRASHCIRRYMDSNIKKLAPADIQLVSLMLRTERPRSQLGNVNVVLGYGELYLAGLIPLRLKTKHFRKLYEILTCGSITYIKNRRKFKVEIPMLVKQEQTEIICDSSSDNDFSSAPVKVKNADRLVVEIKPKTMIVLLLMKQRAFSPNVKIDIPTSCKVLDLVDRLINYWRLPRSVFNNSLLLYHLNETIDEKNNKTSTIRLLLESEYFMDLKSKLGGDIKLMYELNYENTPVFSISTLTILTLNMIPKLAKTFLDLDESVHAFKKPLRPFFKLQPRLVVKEPQIINTPDIKQTLPARIRMQKTKLIETIEKKKTTIKRRVTTLAIGNPTSQENVESSPIQNPMTSDFDFKIFGFVNNSKKINCNQKESNFDDANNNDSRFTIPFDQNNLDPFQTINIDQKHQSDLLNKNTQNTPYITNNYTTHNDESNLGFLAHFGFSNQKETLLSTPINPHFQIGLNEDSHPPTNFISPEMMETPKFEFSDLKENKKPANVGRKLFFNTDQN